MASSVQHIRWQDTPRTPSFALEQHGITDRIGTTDSGEKIRVVRMPHGIQERLHLNSTPYLKPMLDDLDRDMGIEQFSPHAPFGDEQTVAYVIPVEATSIRHIGFQNIGHAPIHPLHVYAQRWGLGDRQSHPAEFAVLDIRLGLNSFTSRKLCILLV